MIQLSLTQEEEVILRDVLNNYLSDLRQEISATDLAEFKDTLKARKDVIMKVLDSLAEPVQ
jgi:LPS O-antigen subunit length determinant protein (WzzB/FepE family)